MFDLGIEKLVVLGLLAMFLIGPDKLPKYAAKLGTWARTLRGMAEDAKQRMKSEMGPEFDDVEWQKLDPRRYHPRQILRDAWNSEDPAMPSAAGPGDESTEPEPEPVTVDAHNPDWQRLAFPRESPHTPDGDPAGSVSMRAPLAGRPADSPDA